MIHRNRSERDRSGRRHPAHAASCQRTFALLAAMAVGGSAAAVVPEVVAQTLPSGGNVVAGSATIGQPDATGLEIIQHSDRAVINWDSFSIGAGNRTDIRQPGTGSVSVQQVVGPAPSEIFGTLASNGRVVLANPNGVWFGPGAHVDVAGIAATTATLSPEAIDRFMAGGRLDFDRPGRPGAAVVNDGTITVAEHGLAALVAPGVANSGLIAARLGRVELASGSRFTLDLNGDGLVELVVGDEVLAQAFGPDGRPLAAAVANGGRILADGGVVLLRADTVKGLVDRAIDMSGVIEARAAAVVGGEIVLSGGDGAVQVDGTLDASGAAAGATGGTVKVLGGVVALGGGSRIDVSGAAGGGTALVGGGARGAGPEPNARTTTVSAGAAIAADATVRGDGGTAVVWADGRTEFAGAVTARGGAAGGDGGFVETSGKLSLRVAEGARVDTRAPRGRTGDWLLDPRNITVGFSGSAALSDVAAFATTPSTDVTIDVATINAATSNVTLQANTDITVNAPILFASAGIDLTMNAGRSIVLNQSVTTNGGSFTATVNDGAAEAADRIAGQASFTMSSGRTIATGGGAVSITTGGFGGGGDAYVGDFSVRTVNSGGGAVTIANAVGDVKGNPDVTAGGGTIALSGHNLQLGDLTTTDTVTLTGIAGGTVTGNGTITAGTLALNGAGAKFDLASEDNAVAHLTGTVADLRFLGLAGFDVAGLTATGAGGITFTTDGTVTQSGPLSATADTLTLNGGAGTYVLDDTGNAVAHLSGTARAITFYGRGGYDVAALTAFDGLTLSGDGAVTQSGAITAPGLLLRGTGSFDFSTDVNNRVTTVAGDTSGAVKLTNADALAVGTVAGVDGITGGSSTLRTLAGDLTLNAPVRAAAAGTAIVVAPAEDFVNNAGAGALSAPAGRWLVYTRDTAGAVFGGLDSANSAVWNATYGTLAPAAVSQSGNRYLIGSQPTVSFVATDSSKTYGDDGSAALQASYGLSGLEPGIPGAFRGDTAATAFSGNPLLTSPGTAATADVAGAPYPVAIAQGSVAGINGYAVGTFTSAAGLTVTPKPLTASLVGTVSKVYDGGTAASLTAANYGLPGVLAGDTVVLATPAAGRYDSKAAGTGKTVSADGLVISGADSGNYTLSSATASGAVGTITPAPLTVSGVTANDKVYDRTTAATLTTGGAVFAGVIGTDVVTLDTGGSTAAFADRTVGAGKAVTVSGLGLGGADGGNYTLAQPAGLTAAITPAPLSVSGVTANDKVYDRTTVATLSTGAATLSGVLAGDAVSLDVSGTAASFADKDAGAGKPVTAAGFALGGADGGNYALSQPAGLTATITPAPLTVSGVTANDKVYDRSTAATLATGGATLSGVLAGDTVSLDVSGTTASFTDKNAGVGKPVTAAGFALGGTDGGNYALAQPTGLTATITPAPLTVSGVTVNDKVYDRTTTATLATDGAALSGVLAGDAVTLNVSSTTASFADKRVGVSKPVTAAGFAVGGADGGNYALAQPTGLTAAITPAPVTVSGVTAIDKVYDRTTAATLSTGAATLSGVFAGDTVSLDVSGTAASFADKDAGTGKPVTAAGFALSGADGGNYALSQPTGLTATITPAPLTVAGVAADDKVYDRGTAATLSTGGATLSGVLAGDAVSLDTSGVTASFADKTVGTGKSVTVSGLVPGGADGANYTLVAQPSGLTADITPAPVTVTGVIANDKVYDRTTAATLSTGAATLSGVFAGDAVSLDVSGTTASFTDKDAGAGKPVTAAGFALGGADGGNYALAQPAGLTATITPAPLTVSGVTANDKVYDRTTAATLSTGSAALSGVLPGDAVSLDLSGATASFADKTVGTGKPVTVSGLVPGGADGANYALVAQPSGLTAAITPAPLAVTGVTVNDKVYDRTTAATLATGGAALSGVLPGDAVALDTSGAAARFADKDVAAGKRVTVTGLLLSGADGGNYVLTQPSGLTATITAAPAAVTGVRTNDRTYDATTAVTLDTGGATLLGVLPGDSVTLDAGRADARVADKGVGTGKGVTVAGLVLTGPDGGNYVLAQPGGLTVTITPAPLTVGGIVANDKVYDAGTAATLATGGASLSGVYGGDRVGLDAGGATARFADKTVGTGKTVTVAGLVLTGPDGGNYVLTQPSGLRAAITPATVTVSGITANGKVYDATTTATLSTGGAVLSGVLGADRIALDDRSYRATLADKNVGTAKPVTVTGLVLGGADAGNYILVQPSGLTADVAAAPLTIIAADAAKTAGDPMPPLTAIYVGLRGADTPSEVTGLTLTVTAGTDSRAGTYLIVPGGATALNYVISYVNGRLVVTEKPVAVVSDPVPASLQAGSPAGLPAGIDTASVSAPVLGVGAGAVPLAGGDETLVPGLSDWISPFGADYAGDRANGFANAVLDGSETVPEAPAALVCAGDRDRAEDEDDCRDLED
ncbi:YDG domain-containing protein [Azospirillum sp. ST 5-10]|uniref:YDG domain-containing protein n=1 Tax=unclassified Azospirillum TaxID=2630922 RepID=UPI003F49D3E8